MLGYNVNHTAYGTTLEFMMELEKFREKLNNQVYIKFIEIKLKDITDFWEVKYLISSYISDGLEYSIEKYNFLSSDEFVIEVAAEHKMLIYVNCTKQPEHIAAYITMYGEPYSISRLNMLLQYHQSVGLDIHWYYLDKGDIKKQAYMVEEYNEAYSEFYPFLPCDMKKFFKNYRDSKNNILVLLGPPGTGKTTFVSNLIKEFNYRTMVSSDGDILRSDELFNKFMSTDRNLLVLEDADILLLDRENNDNKVMSRLLNSSDGLVKINNKKIIFSANLTSINDIDSALIRPGRCFDVITFRNLTQEEAFIVANKMNITLSQPYKDEYSLAEILNNKNSISNQKKIGFV